METTSHPMDDIPVRKLRFKLDDTSPAVWSRSCPEFSIFINALGIHVPYFERFLVKIMRRHRDEIKDGSLASDALQADLKSIIGQESHHAFNFVNWTRVMCGRYPELAKLDQSAKRYFESAADEALASKKKKFNIGLTAGYETFTFLAGLIILNRYEELMADADPAIRALWIWHQVEEVEHGAVAFDFYRAFYPDSEWHRRFMVIYAFIHIIWETFKSYRHMIDVEGYNRSWSSKFRAWRFFAKFGWDLVYSSIPVLKRNYHPRNHPICTSNQNQIALAWREYYRSGNDAHSLSDQVMVILNQKNQ